MRPAWKGLKRGAPNPVIMGKRFCPQCGRWRYVVDFGVKIERRSGAPVVMPRSYCDTCQNRSNHRSYKRRKMTPEQLAAWREYQRIWHEGKRRAQGIPPRNYNYAPDNPRRRRTVVDRTERVFLDPRPLVKAAKVYIRNERSNGNPTYDWRTLARAARMDERQLFRYRSGESTLIRIDIADRWAMAMGLHIDHLYQDARVTKQAHLNRRAYGLAEDNEYAGRAG